MVTISSELGAHNPLPRPLVTLPCLPRPLVSLPCSFGDTPSAEPATFVGVYQARAIDLLQLYTSPSLPPSPCLLQLYFFFPIVVIARLWLHDAPFSTPLPPRLAGALFLVGSSTLAVFFSYILKWMATYTPAALPNGLREPLLQLAASLP